MLMREDDNDKVLITKKRLAELEYDSKLLHNMLANSHMAVEFAFMEARDELTQEDINNGEYDK